MRKITLLFSFFAFTFLGYGQYLTEGFEGATIPPAGWTHNQTSATETWEITTTVFHSGSNAATVNYHATDAQDETLVTPSMDLSSATSPRVRFWFSMSYYWSINPNDNYDFKVSVKDNTTSTTTEIWTEASQGTFDNFTWYEVTLDLTAYAGKNDIQIEFNYSGTDGAALYFDDIIVEEAPTCEVPTALTVANIGTTSVDIGWTASTTGETAWEYVVQAAGGSAPSGAGTGTSTNPTNVTGLTANTAYEFYVRADCTGGDYSSWVGPMAFTTACDTFTAPYSEDFENAGAIPNCWTMSGGEDWLFANTGSGNHIG
ncbi:MAG: fibronectin type III domain-containing protein, partial [Polaribacter sp.]